MSSKRNNKSGMSAPAKVITMSVVAILLGFGLCSVGGGWFESDASLRITIGAFAFWGGVVGFGVGVFWWLFKIVSRS